jgi:hypothetical protein
MAIAALAPGLASAEAMRLSDVTGAWDVIVHGASQSRFLEIISPPEVAGAEATANARYDITGRRGAVIKVMIRVSGDIAERITFTTQAGTLVDVAPVSASRLSGRFTVKQGPAPVMLWRRRTEGDVPGSTLVGAWDGAWRDRFANSTQTRLIVVHADATAASFRYEWDASTFSDGTPGGAGGFWGTGEVDHRGRLLFTRGKHNWLFERSGNYLAGRQGGPGYMSLVLMQRTPPSARSVP